MPRKKKEKPLKDIVDAGVRQALTGPTGPSKESLQALSLAIDWVKVVEKLNERDQMGSGLRIEETED